MTNSQRLLFCLLATGPAWPSCVHTPPGQSIDEVIELKYREWDEAGLVLSRESVTYELATRNQGNLYVVLSVDDCDPEDSKRGMCRREFHEHRAEYARARDKEFAEGNLEEIGNALQQPLEHITLQVNVDCIIYEFSLDAEGKLVTIVDQTSCKSKESFSTIAMENITTCARGTEEPIAWALRELRDRLLHKSFTAVAKRKLTGRGPRRLSWRVCLPPRVDFIMPGSWKEVDINITLNDWSDLVEVGVVADGRFGSATNCEWNGNTKELSDAEAVRIAGHVLKQSVGLVCCSFAEECTLSRK